MTANNPQPDFKALEAANRRVSELTGELSAARVDRDDKIRELHEAGVTAYRLAQVVGISQTAIAKIVKNPEN